MGSAAKAVGGAVGSAAGGVVGGIAGKYVGGKIAGSGEGPGGILAPINVKQSRKDITEDIRRGEEELGVHFKEGSLGRLDAGRSADVSSIVESRRAGLQGLSAEENQALRERASQSIDRGSQTALRQLRGSQGISGVRGGTAGAQQATVLAAGQQAKGRAERDLLIQNVEAKRQALGDFEATVTGAEATEQERSLFNIGQKGKEQFGRLSSGLGFAQLGVQERAAARGVSVAQSNVAAAGKGGKI